MPIDIPEKKTLADIGLDPFSQSPLRFSGSEINQKAQIMFESGVPSNFIQDGETIVRLTVVDGYLQSPDYVEGESGWRIGADGNVEFGSGFFRGDISASSGTFGNVRINTEDAPNAIAIDDDTHDRVWQGFLEGKM